MQGGTGKLNVPLNEENGLLKRSLKRRSMGDCGDTRSRVSGQRRCRADILQEGRSFIALPPPRTAAPRRLSASRDAGGVSSSSRTVGMGDFGGERMRASNSSRSDATEALDIRLWLRSSDCGEPGALVCRGWAGKWGEKQRTSMDAQCTEGGTP